VKSDIKNEKLLSAGGSLSQEELGKIVVLDIETLDFWKHGMKFIVKIVLKRCKI
jgi:oligoendopeptidase F